MARMLTAVLYNSKNWKQLNFLSVMAMFNIDFLHPYTGMECSHQKNEVATYAYEKISKATRRKKMTYIKECLHFCYKNLCVGICITFSIIIYKTVSRGYFWGIELGFGRREICNFNV